MRKVIALAMVLALCAAAACAEGGRFALRFEDGFSLTLPDGWVSYPAGGDGVRYALGDGDGRYLYILAQPAKVDDFAALQAAVARRANCETTGALDLNGQSFAAFIASDLNASGCATLLDGQVYIFLFTPRDDADYMQTVAQVMASFEIN